VGGTQWKERLKPKKIAKGFFGSFRVQGSPQLMKGDYGFGEVQRWARRGGFKRSGSKCTSQTQESLGCVCCKSCQRTFVNRKQKKIAGKALRTRKMQLPTEHKNKRRAQGRFYSQPGNSKEGRLKRKQKCHPLHLLGPRPAKNNALDKGKRKKIRTARAESGETVTAEGEVKGRKGWNKPRATVDGLKKKRGQGSGKKLQRIAKKDEWMLKGSKNLESQDVWAV